MVLLLWLRDEVFDHGVVLHTGRLHRTASAGSLSLALAASRRSSTLASASGASAAASLSRNGVDAVLNELRGVDPLHVRCVPCRLRQWLLPPASPHCRLWHVHDTGWTRGSRRLASSCSGAGTKHGCT